MNDWRSRLNDNKLTLTSGVFCPKPGRQTGDRNFWAIPIENGTQGLLDLNHRRD
jgi:hypothetical protein